MQTLASIMTPRPASIVAGDSILHAAQLMDELNVGSLPVCEGDRLIGIVTDRDIIVRAVAQNLPAEQTQVSAAMSGGVQWCYDDDSIDEARDKMETMQVRRIPVVNREQHLVGIISLGDLAVRTGDSESTLEQISEPSQPDR